jgi:hypothetical protein
MIFRRPSANFLICLSSYIKLESLIILIRLVGTARFSQARNETLNNAIEYS